MHSKVRSIADGEFDACLDLWDKSFSNTPRDYFVRYFHGDPWFKPQYTRLYAEGDDLLSCVQIVRRTVKVGEARLVMGGISNVGTPPEHRGKGYSTECLKSSVEVMEQDGFDFSILYTGIQAFYERLGWVTIPVCYFTGEIRQPLPHADATYAICNYDPDADAGELLDVYGAFSEQVVLSAERTLDYWKGFAMFNPKDVRLARAEDGRMAGYLIGSTSRETPGIFELAYLPGQEGCVGELLLSFASQALNEGKTRLHAYLPEHPVFAGGLDAVLAECEAPQMRGGMLKVIDLERLMSKMLVELSARAETAGVSGNLLLETDIGAVGLDIKPGAVTLSDGGRCTEALKMTQVELCQALFGLAELRGELARALFPKRPSIYWFADHF